LRFITYLFVRAIALIMAIVPFRLAYGISDFFFLIIYHLVGYRKKVVMENLHRAFPEKSRDEIRKISVKFYHSLADLMIEGLKGISMTKKQVIKRHKMLNPEILQPYYDKGISVIGVTGHFGNWEWGALSGGLQIPHPLIALYKPLTNHYLDRYMRRRRAQFNCRLASIKETYSTFENTQDERVAYMMVADQSPTNIQECYWVTFLGQETACLHGPEKYARLFRLPVLYLDIQPRKRGFYEMTLTLLSDDISEWEPGKLTGMFMNELEKRIIERPEYWLWSHRRWKHRHPQEV
jgi:Kdo2-lipid IVA lauroyltransferase/acyltransferase